MKPAELRDKTPDQLKDEILKLKKQQFNLRFQKATGQLENTAQVGNVRRDIARAKTIVNEKARGLIVRATSEAAKLSAPKPAKSKTAKPKSDKPKVAPKAAREKSIRPEAAQPKMHREKTHGPKAAKAKGVRTKSAMRRVGSE